MTGAGQGQSCSAKCSPAEDTTALTGIKEEGMPVGLSLTGECILLSSVYSQQKLEAMDIEATPACTQLSDRHVL